MILLQKSQADNFEPQEQVESGQTLFFSSDFGDIHLATSPRPIPPALMARYLVEIGKKPFSIT